MEKLLVVDGMNLLFQMFYGMPARISGPHGQPIQGTLGFVGALLKILRMVQPTHAVVLFDGETCNPRKEMDEDYKANRPDYSQMPEEETPFCQLPDVYRALDVLRISHAETVDCEADDWMAGYAKRYGTDREVVIASFDSDLWQLITDRVKVLRYRGEKTAVCDQAYIKNRLDITPAQYADHKALTGDSSDNIRGAEHIGPKTAAALLHQFGSLEQILAKVEEISKPSVRESVKRNGPRLRLNQLLIRLDGSDDLPFELEALHWCDRGWSTTEVLRAVGLR